MKKTVYLIGVVMMLSGCYKSEINNTTTPDKATLEINVKWGNLHTGDNKPSSFTLLHNSKQESYNKDFNLVILEPKANEEFLAYNLPSGISIADGIATLGKATRTVIDPETNPQHIYYGVGKVDLIKDFVTKLTIATKRGTAPLTLKLAYVKSELTNIKSVKIEFGGIATTRNLRTDVLSKAGILTKYPRLDPNANELIVSYNILGIVGNKQELKLTFTANDNQTKVVISDLNKQLTDFNQAMKPLILAGNMNLASDMETVGSISDWENVTEGNGTAN